jgi:hypothetical protein
MRSTLRAVLLAASGLLAAVTAYEVIANPVPDRAPIDTSASALPPAPTPVRLEPGETSPPPPSVIVVRDPIPREIAREESGVSAPAVTDDPPQIPRELPFEARLADFERAMIGVTNGEAQVVPELEGNELIGLHVSAIQEDSRLAQVGIEEDDVVTEFNGIAIDSPFVALHVVREMLESDGYRVVVRRGDAMVELGAASDDAG